MSATHRRLQSGLTMAAILSLAACNTQSADPAIENVAKAEPTTPANALAVADVLRRAKIPVVAVKEVSEVSDDNHLLGRPGQYTSKLFFYDGRHRNSEDATEGENTIEVFPTALDAKRRHDYVAAMTSGMGMLTQYQILQGAVLVRLDKVVLPSEAKEYERVIDAAMR